MKQRDIAAIAAVLKSQREEASAIPEAAKTWNALAAKFSDQIRRMHPRLASATFVLECGGPIRIIEAEGR